MDYRNVNARSRIILDTTYVCLHIDVKNTIFLLCAPHFDLQERIYVTCDNTYTYRKKFSVINFQ